MKILFISLECADPAFSGNGTYSRSLINSLLRHQVQTFVVSASPSANNALYPKEWQHNNNFKGHVINVPSDKWYRHDISSSWHDFSDGVDKDVALHEEIKQFSPSIIIGVDWASVLPFQHISKEFPNIPFVYLNFRVFHTNPGLPQDEKDFYQSREHEACMLANKTITLSPYDTSALQKFTLGKPIETLLPPLPHKIHNLALSSPHNSYSHPRKYLLCCVRLSREKNVEVFVEVCTKLASFLADHNIIPYMCGAAQSKEYAEELQTELQQAVPSAVFSDIMSHDALVEVYKQSILNFHPALYEAYGLTIVEAAAFGTPSVVHKNGGGIGATALLKEARFVGLTRQEIFSVNMLDAAAVALEVRRIILDQKDRQDVANRAKAKSLSWGETENGDQFLKYLEGL